MATLPRYLGLDISNFTGYALVEGDKFTRSGVRDFSIKSHERPGKRLTNFYNFLVTFGRVDEIYYEKIAFGGGFKNKKTGAWISTTNDGRELYHKLVGVVEMYAAGFDIPHYSVHPMTLKKEFTGHGHADKEAMCKGARALGWKGGKDGTAFHHDEADGIAILSVELRKKYGIIAHF